jgi:hypothetical protein
MPFAGTQARIACDAAFSFLFCEFETPGVSNFYWAFLVMYKNISMRRLRQRENDFAAHRLMAEMISPLAGLMPN